MVDTFDKMYYGLIGTIFVILIGAWFYTFPIESSMGIVIEVHQSKIVWECTTVKFATFSDRSSTIALEGLYDDIKVGHVYRVTYQNQGHHLYNILIEIEDLGPSSFYTGERKP